jgi:hypothetical protein
VRSEGDALSHILAAKFLEQTKRTQSARPLRHNFPDMVKAIGSVPLDIVPCPFSGGGSSSDLPVNKLKVQSLSRSPPSSPESVSARRNASPFKTKIADGTGPAVESHAMIVAPIIPSTADVFWPCCPVAAQDPPPPLGVITTHEPRWGRSIEENQVDQHRLASLQSLLSRSDGNDDDPTPKLELTGVLEGTNIFYRIVRVLVEGVLHKKGTGLDWLRSRGWKARWTRLCLARVDGWDANVPLLCVSWYQNSRVCSTVIILDGTVVLGLNKQQPEGSKKNHVARLQWNNSRFEIRHAATKDNFSLPTLTRVFTAPSRKARDAWVYAISQALLTYEKEKAAAAAGNQHPSSSRWHHHWQETVDEPVSSPVSPLHCVGSGTGWSSAAAAAPLSPVVGLSPRQRPKIPRSPRRRTTTRPRTTTVSATASEPVGPTNSM